MVELYHVNKDYGRGNHALVDVSFTVEKGDFVFLTGASGAGKTTLLRLLFREEDVTSGKILVDDMNVTSLPASKIPFLRRRLGVVFQDFKLLQRRTVFENVSMVMEITGKPRAERRAKTYAVLEMLGLNHKVRNYPLELSGGEQQRVAIARALVNEPALLLADEPTGNLDPQLSWEMMNLFKAINIRGTTVLVATHDKDLITRMGKQVLTLDCGRLVTH
jgi:cell division transport system ATP-binding protein